MAGPDFIPDEVIAAEQAGDFISDEQIEQEMAALGGGWNIGDSISQGLSGLGEGAVNTLMFAAENMPQLYGPLSGVRSALSGGKDRGIMGGGSAAAGAVLPSVTAAPDPQYSTERTVGNFVGGNLVMPGMGLPMKVATGVGGGLGQVVGEKLTAGGEENVWDKIIPFAFSVAGAMGPQATADFAKGVYSLFRSATPAEIKGSAAHIIQNDLSMKADDLSRAIDAAPADEMGSLMSTAELTQNAQMAQLEKILASDKGAAQIYNQRAVQREGARMDALYQGLPAVNKEGLGTELMQRATAVEKRLGDKAQGIWQSLPRGVAVDIGDQQRNIASILAEGQGYGLPPGSKVRTLVDQFLGDPDRAANNIRTTGALQRIRSDSLSLLRDANLDPTEIRLLNAMQQGADEAVKRLEGTNAYQIWTDARAATSRQKETFGQFTAGEALTRDSARPANVLASAIKGDKQSIDELLNATLPTKALKSKIKRGFLDMVKTDTDKVLTQNNMKRFLEANDGAAKELLGEKHYSQLTRIYDDLKSENSVAKIGLRASKGGSVTSQRNTVAGAIEEALASAVMPGIGGPLAIVIDGIKRSVGAKNAEGVKDLIFQAALEPGFALELSKAPTTTRIFNGLERLHQFAGNAAVAGARGGLLDIARPDSATGQSPSGQTDRLRRGSAGIASSATPVPSGAAAPRQPLQQGPQAGGLSNTSYDPDNIFSKQKEESVFTREDADHIFDKKVDQTEIPAVVQSLKSAVRMVESSGGKFLRGPRLPEGDHALGPFQFRPATARMVNKKHGTDYDPMTEEGGEALFELYMTELLQRYDGNVRKALAAYGGAVTPSKASAYIGKIRNAFETA